MRFYSIKFLKIQTNIENNLKSIQEIKKYTEDQIKKLEDDCSAKIAKLEQDNANNQSLIDPIKDENKKIQNKVAIYDSACEQYKYVIQEDINKIQTLL